MDTPTSSLLIVEQVPIDDLHPDFANPRRISDEELDSLTRSLRQFGFVQPVLARRENHVVIGGHQRLVAARRLGRTEVPVTFLDISLDQARLLNLALNRISGTWDEQLLARLLADHPAQKPALLSEIPLRNHTKPGEAVYDPFLGSGTTLIAAERLSRACYGMELDPRCADVILLRWERFAGARADRLDG